MRPSRSKGDPASAEIQRRRCKGTAAPTRRTERSWRTTAPTPRHHLDEHVRISGACDPSGVVLRHPPARHCPGPKRTVMESLLSSHERDTEPRRTPFSSPPGRIPLVSLVTHHHRAALPRRHATAGDTGYKEIRTHHGRLSSAEASCRRTAHSPARGSTLGGLPFLNPMGLTGESLSNFNTRGPGCVSSLPPPRAEHTRILARRARSGRAACSGGPPLDRS